VRFEALGESDDLWVDLIRAIGQSVLVDAVGRKSCLADCSRN